ncbi:MAG TPA: hypothetical protein VK509_05030 [Polyangiales bacterium]|nr:hypothetical protein [Polyangiales bacterium]
MTRYSVLALISLLAFGTNAACSSGDDDDDAAGMTASGAGSSAAGSSAAGGSSGGKLECVNEGEINFDCPFNLPPIMGSCAPAGVCCHRSSNIAKIEKLGPDESAVLEYRLNFVDIVNHPLSVGLPDLQRTAAQRADVCAGEQCLLWRFTAPRKGGEYVAGPGVAEIGIGAYNCDGTYSFYGAKAGSDRSADIGEKDPGRWQGVAVPAVYDPAKQGTARIHIPWATNKNRAIQRSLFLLPADNSLDWELASSGFEITQLDTSDPAQDCIGARDGSKWSNVDGFVSYSPLLGNEKDISNQINQTYCSLLAFGLLPEGKKNKDCIATERCMPDGGNFGDGGCDWLKLPDSLCPTDEAQRAIFGCHLGAEGNPNAETGYPSMLNCTPEKPTAALDPDMGATSVGQCCDPLGKSMQLPACNAYRTVGKFVAAAAEITDAPRDNLPPVCQ